jgi:hypothetical protein
VVVEISYLKKLDDYEGLVIWKDENRTYGRQIAYAWHFFRGLPTLPDASWRLERLFLVGERGQAGAPPDSPAVIDLIAHFALLAATRFTTELRSMGVHVPEWAPDAVTADHLWRETKWCTHDHRPGARFLVEQKTPFPKPTIYKHDWRAGKGGHPSSRKRRGLT